MTPEAMDMVPTELPNEELQAPSKEPIYAVRRDEQPHREIVVWSEHSFDLSTMASGMQRSLRENQADQYHNFLVQSALGLRKDLRIAPDASSGTKVPTFADLDKYADKVLKDRAERELALSTGGAGGASTDAASSSAAAQSSLPSWMVQQMQIQEETKMSGKKGKQPTSKSAPKQAKAKAKDVEKKAYKKNQGETVFVDDDDDDLRGQKGTSKNSKKGLSCVASASGAGGEEFDENSKDYRVGLAVANFFSGVKGKRTINGVCGLPGCFFLHLHKSLALEWLSSSRNIPM